MKAFACRGAVAPGGSRARRPTCTGRTSASSAPDIQLATDGSLQSTASQAAGACCGSEVSMGLSGSIRNPSSLRCSGSGQRAHEGPRTRSNRLQIQSNRLHFCTRERWSRVIENIGPARGGMLHSPPLPLGGQEMPIVQVWAEVTQLLMRQRGRRRDLRGGREQILPISAAQRTTAEAERLCLAKPGTHSRSFTHLHPMSEWQPSGHQSSY